MSPNVRTLIQFVFLVCAMGAIFLWLIASHPGSITWTLRFALPAVALMAGWLLYRSERREERLTDHLGQILPKYFESNGLCFGFAFKPVGGVCWVHIFFQNRYEKPCVAQVGLVPRRFAGWYKMSGIYATVECDGGAFGVVHVPWVIPAKYQGKKLRFEVGAVTKYHTGKGKILRYREGLRALGVPTFGARVGSTIATIALGLVGVIRVSGSAWITLTMPRDVAETLPAGLSSLQEILWRPDLPTGGFPVAVQSPVPVEPL